jgi:hypothetical protein
LFAGDDGTGVGALFIVLGAVTVTAVIAAWIGIVLRRRGK